MALSFPLSAPSAWVFGRSSMSKLTAVAQSVSPFTLQPQTYAHQGQRWAMDVSLPALAESDALEVIGFLSALNGQEGSCLLPPPRNPGVRGTWAGSPKVLGAHAAGVMTLAMDGFTPGATVKYGDWFQIGSGSASHIHHITAPGTADGSGLLNLEIWPRTRAALADDATLTTSSPKGIWQLADNEQRWDYELAQIYGISVRFIEDLRS